MRAGAIRAVLIWVGLGLFTVAGGAQELSPRAYWPTPKGTKVAILGFSYSSGDVAVDPSLPVDGVDSRITAALAAYVQTFSLWGRTTNFIVEVPYNKGTTEGELLGDAKRSDFSGMGDLALTVSVNLIGAPTMTPADFQELRANPRPIFGVSFKVKMPTGKYDSEKLINIGGNRWAFKGEMGYTFPIRPRLLLELELGAWAFGNNYEFLGGTREQAPIVAAEIHLIRRFRPGFWGSLEWNYYTGGRTTVNGVLRADLERNSRIGGTLVVPTVKRQAVKIGYSTGVVTTSGGDYEIVLVSYQVAF